MKNIEEFKNKIICGDCLEVMKDIPDKSVDLVLTDPPFGINGEQEIKITEKALKIAKKKAKNMVVIMDWRYSHRISSLFEKEKIGEMIWEYSWISGGRSKAKYGILPTHNIILMFGDIKDFHFLTGSIIKRQKGFSSPRQCSYANKTGHPFEKPIALIKYLLEKIDANLILDPFLGSGTTAVAVKQLKRNFIGIEINPDYCKIAEDRLKQQLLFHT